MPGEINRVPVPDLCSLWAERAATPMHVALAGVLDRVPAHVQAHVEARLPATPMLLTRLRMTRIGEGSPVWVDAAHFDVHDHVHVMARYAALNDAAFLEWCAVRSVVPLRHDRPLWRLDVVPMTGGRTGVLFVVHHVVTDGLRGAEMLAQLLDEEPTNALSVLARSPRPAPLVRELVADNVARRLAAVRGAPQRLRRAPDRVASLVRLARGEGAGPGDAADAPFNGPIAQGRRIRVVRRSVADLRSDARALGVTVNDLLLAAVTTGLRPLVGGADVPSGVQVRASVPIGARNGSPGGMMIVPLPVGEPDDLLRLQRIAAETRSRKAEPDDGIAGIVSLSPALAHLGVAWARRAARSRVQLYVTNVPGPPNPLYLSGARLLDAVAFGPLVADVRLAVTAMSYAGELAVALLSDDDAERPLDLDAVQAGVEHGFAALHDAAATRAEVR